MFEINLLNSYPNLNRDTAARAKSKTQKQIDTALKFGWEYFDKKGICYNGYFYDGRWISVVKKFVRHYNIKKNDKILDVGCAKGYMLYDFKHEMPDLELAGIDISEYAIGCSPPEVKNFLQQGNAKNLSMFEDNYFDLVISINTIHSFKTLEEIEKAISEIQRVSKKNSYLVIDSYKTTEEKKRMEEWMVAGYLLFSEDEWKNIFKKVGYTGDYYWFKP